MPPTDQELRPQPSVGERAVSERRRPYSPPRVTPLGRVVDLTLSGGVTSSDSTFSKKAKVG